MIEEKIIVEEMGEFSVIEMVVVDNMDKELMEWVEVMEVEKVYGD